jgi:hypothetical protein
MMIEKKKPGGQPGNQNAFKHGLYASSFSRQERQKLENLQEADLQQEIEMLRVMTKRVFEMAEGVDSLDTAVKVLTSLGVSATRLANLVRVQRTLDQDEELDMGRAISRALAEMRREMGLESPDGTRKEVQR